MDNFNKEQKRIIREEFARAIMIQKAKNELNEEQFAVFINELTDYEQNLVLNESNQGEFLYEGFFQRLKNLAKGAIRKLAPDDQEKIEDLANEIEVAFGTAEGFKEMGYEATSAAKKAKMQQLLAQMAEINPQAAQGTAKAYGVPFGGGGAAGGGEKTAGGGEKAPPPTGDVRSDAQTVGNSLESPKAKGIFASIYDSYKYAFATNAAAWRRIYDIMNGVGTLPVQQQTRAVQKVQDKIKKEMPPPDPNKTDPNKKDGDEEGKVHKVGDLQDKIILTLNKVLDTKNVDMSRKDTMELAKKITKNLVDQMVANGIEFKGMRAQVAEAVATGLFNRILLKEEEGAEGAEQPEEKPKKEKPENDRVEKLIRLRVKRFTMNPLNYIEGLKKVRREFAEKEYGKKQIFKQYINSDVEQEFVGLYDAYLDVMALGKAFKILKKKSKEDTRIADILKKADAEQIMVAGMKVRGRKISSLVVHFANFYRLASNDNQAPDHPAQLRKYMNFKKKAVRQQKGGQDAKDMYKPEKVPDAKLPQGKKGTINVKNLIFQALKGMQITGDQAKDIESLLNKRLQGVAKQYIAKGMEIRVLEEKLNRYANSIIKELKNAM